MYNIYVSNSFIMSDDHDKDVNFTISECDKQNRTILHLASAYRFIRCAKDVSIFFSNCAYTTDE